MATEMILLLIMGAGTVYGFDLMLSAIMAGSVLHFTLAWLALMAWVAFWLRKIDNV